MAGPTIWLVGRGGMLGQELAGLLTQEGLEWTGSGREVDVTDAEALAAFAKSLPNPTSWVINSSAWTAVDQAEAEPEACERLNRDGAKNLAQLASELGAGLIHVSTDYVFDGKGLRGDDGNLRPYFETDAVAPQGVYGKTKAAGEQAVSQNCQKHLIFRTAWLYGAAGGNFVHTMLRLMKAKDSLGIVADQYGSPTWTKDLAKVIVKALRANRPVWGTYHASGEGWCSWYDFAEAILVHGRAIGLLDPNKSVELKSLTTLEFPTVARRPSWSVLSKVKLKQNFGLTMPAWRESLACYLQEIHSKGMLIP
jgi:dTDP-4-dehydrorhamnose reductase